MQNHADQRELIIPQGSLLAVGTFKDHIDCMWRIVRGQETDVRWQHSAVTDRLATSRLATASPIPLATGTFSSTA